ncbi:Fe-regulated protein 8 [Vanrija pseudolonga]|uniref:Fe-regulated protein 8 n=1 Tax=Vanrija pseudolonga TaxID=143232 RepID=A0AAF1BHC9_9TREE|nr:Fe-regulated protein 8 [Vanrija pseudolonga]
MTIDTQPKTVVVLGVAYGGVGALATLAKLLPPGWRVLGIERSTHAHHVYVFPRFSVLPAHAPRALVPLVNAVYGGRVTPGPEISPKGVVAAEANDGRHELVRGLVTSLTATSVTYALPINGEYPADLSTAETRTVEFEYAIYALGGVLSAPSDAWGRGERDVVAGRGGKPGAVSFLKSINDKICAARRVLVVGGGALGIQFASDIKATHNDKEVTLLHSRERLLPLYHQATHDAVVDKLGKLGVKTVLGERVTSWPDRPLDVDGEDKVVVTDKGSTLTADLVLVCTGSKPNTALFAGVDPAAILPNGLIHVGPTLQVANTEWFAIGDAADSEGIFAGHESYAQGSCAARNILRLIEVREGRSATPLEEYKAGPVRIKVSLGINEYVVGTADGATTHDDGPEDIHAKLMWSLFGVEDKGDEE